MGSRPVISAGNPRPARPIGRAIVVPKLVADAGKRFANFFGSIENDNTRSAYQRVCMLFLRLVVPQPRPGAGRHRAIHVGAYVRALGKKFEKPTVPTAPGREHRYRPLSKVVSPDG